MKIGIVTATNPATCTCRVRFPDHDAMESWWLPVVQKKSLRDKSYWMPDVGEHVACHMDDNAEFGVVLGAIYSDADQPPVANQDKYHVAFDDGTTIEYDRAEHRLTADVKGDADVATTGDIRAVSVGNADVRTSGWAQVVGTGVVLIKSKKRLILKGPRRTIRL